MLYIHVVSLFVIFIFTTIKLIFYHYIALCFCVTRPQGSINDIRGPRGCLEGERELCNTLYIADHAPVSGIKSKDCLDYKSTLAVS